MNYVNEEIIIEGRATNIAGRHETIRNIKRWYKTVRTDVIGANQE